MDTAVPVIALDHPAALEASRVGRDAAALASARAAGLPVGPGVVLTGDWHPSDDATARLLWRIVSHDGARPLTVAASPVDPRSVSAAVVVHDADTLLAAARDVRLSGARVPVLVRPHEPGAWRGTMTPVPPRHRWDQSWSVRAGSWAGELDRAGRLVSAGPRQHVAHPPADVLARLARLGDRLAAMSGVPPSIEWAADAAGITLVAVRPPSADGTAGTASVLPLVIAGDHAA